MIAPALATRFRADLTRVRGEPAGGPLAVAVSGGGDSMALLALAAAALPGRVIAATVDHLLRPDAAAEAAGVAAQCAALGIDHATLRPDAAPSGASLQARARDIRYDLLVGWARARGAAALATAHHADDQAETFLMRAARGSGAAGLAGIRARTMWDGLAVVRPLLDWRRAELRGVALAAGLTVVDDPANDDPRHDRTRFRRLLGEHPWLDAGALARSAGALGEADAELRAMAEWVARERARPAAADEVAIDVAGLPRELCRRVARGAIGRVRALCAIDVPAWDEARNVEPLLDALAAGRAATQAGVLAVPEGGVWRFRAAPPRRG